MTNILPELDAVRGIRSEGGRDERKGRIVLQYEDTNGRRHELGMSLSDAMLIMRQLEDAQRELDIPVSRPSPRKH